MAISRSTSTGWVNETGGINRSTSTGWLQQQSTSTVTTITPTGKSSDEAFGSFTLRATRIVLPSAKVSDEAFGTPTITVSGALPVLFAATVINITTTTATPRVTITI